MERKRIMLLAIILMLAIGNYSRLPGNENIRLIHFVSIFSIGAIAALLIKELAVYIKNRKA